MPFELSSLMQLIGRLLAVVFVGLMLFNGIMMFVSPNKWLDMPHYLALHGSLRRRDQKAYGHVEIRVVGLVITAVIMYALSTAFATPVSSGMIAAGSATSQSWRGWVGLMTCVAVSVYGFLMLLRPRWFIRKYVVKGSMPDEEGQVLVFAVRLLSLPVIGASSYVAWRYIAGAL